MASIAGFLSRIRPVRDEAGNITRWYGTATNVDEQRQLLQSLSEAREDLEKRVEERTAELRTATEVCGFIGASAAHAGR